MNFPQLIRYSCSVVLFIAVLYFLDFDAFYGLIVDADLRFLLLSAVLSMFAAGLRALFLSSLLTGQGYISLSYRISVTQLVSQILPFKLGEAAFLLPSSNKTTPELLGSLIRLRIMELTASLAFCLVIVLFVFPNALTLAFLLGLCLFSIIVLGAFVSKYIVLFLNEKWRSFLAEFIKISPSKLIKEILFYGLPICLIQFGAFYVLTLALGIKEFPLEYTILFSVAVIAGIIPLSLFAGIGIRQFAILGVASLVVFSHTTDLIVYSVSLQLLNLANLFLSSLFFLVLNLFFERRNNY